jgi:predicted  nucleic acid-binding Zn-ribbon protein
VLATPAMAVKSNVAVAENILDKLIALVKEYTGRVEAATSMEELDTAYWAFKQEMAEFTERHADEIASFDKNLTTEEVEKYKVAFETAIKHFEKSLEKKARQFME